MAPRKGGLSPGSPGYPENNRHDYENGATSCSGGPFRGSAEIVGVPPSIHVDLWILGCPPHPLTIPDGLLRVIGRIEPNP